MVLVMHIKKIELHRFKQYKDKIIDLKDGLSLIVGGNNSGKSTILQALAAWQFCKTLIEIEKGRFGWLQTSGKTGVGMGIVDFTPLQVPSLAHLWTNLKTSKVTEPDGYTMKIKVCWDIAGGTERHLEMGMSLANDRLFVKSTSTNLIKDEIVDEKGNPITENVPSVAYLPPFAGITDREGRLTPAMRERLVGQGLSGGVIRNMLFELHEQNKNTRVKLKGEKTKLTEKDLETLRKTDPWEMLTTAMQTTFGAELRFVPFNERYHSYLRVECFKGSFDEHGKFKRYQGYNPRDLMVEGQGFLQWLSVYALSLSPDINVVLLDEPDAHLNAALQKDLLQSLDHIAQIHSKQILMATHSPELIRLHEHERILAVGKKIKYMSSPEDRVGVLAGIGTVHTPSIHALMQHERILILEGPSDLRLLKKVASRISFTWPENIVAWYWTGKASERAQLFRQLKNEIPRLRGISIRDRDNEDDATVDASLVDRNHNKPPDKLSILKWRRRHIENYLLNTQAIARASNRAIADVEAFFKEHALALPDDTTPSDIVLAIRDAHGKELMINGKSIESTFKVTRDQVADTLLPGEVAEDFKTFFTLLEELSKS
jgi:predicted ATPase